MDEKLIAEIKDVIIDALNLEDVKPEDIITTEPLFGDGLGLDSIDALELGLAIKKNFGVAISANAENVKEHFYSVETLAKFISENKKG